MSDISKASINLHKIHQGKLSTHSLIPLNTREDLALAYTPGVGAVSTFIAENKERAWTHTLKGRTIAVVSDGSAVLGLGNIGPEAALPVMEGKCALFKEFGGIDAIPLCINTQDTEEIITFVKNIAPTFGGINLEDISAPRCFEIEKRLQNLGIPVFHDDQHGTAIVVLAGLINAAKVVQKELSSLKVVINGAGAAGTAIARLILGNSSDERLVKNVVSCDSKGIISRDRNDLNSEKQELVELTQQEKGGSLEDALKGADVFIGVSAAGALSPTLIPSMNPQAIIFALANPTPEIYPDEALNAGAAVVATGRSDYPNQINNVLVFPGIFKGALMSRTSTITFAMKRVAAFNLASLVHNPSPTEIIPDPFNPTVAQTIAQAVCDTQ